jgi:hypothetical protein
MKAGSPSPLRCVGDLRFAGAGKQKEILAPRHFSDSSFSNPIDGARICWRMLRERFLVMPGEDSWLAQAWILSQSFWHRASAAYAPMVPFCPGLDKLAGHRTITMSAWYAHLSLGHKLSGIDHIAATAIRTATRRKRPLPREWPIFPSHL